MLCLQKTEKQIINHCHWYDCRVGVKVNGSHLEPANNQEG